MTQLPVGTPAARAPRRPSVARPALRVVRPQPRAISHLPFVLLCAGVLAAGLIAVLLLNTALAKGSYEAHALEDRSAQLDEQQAAYPTLHGEDLRYLPARLGGTAPTPEEAYAADHHDMTRTRDKFSG